MKEKMKAKFFIRREWRKIINQRERKRETK